MDSITKQLKSEPVPKLDGIGSILLFNTNLLHRILDDVSNNDLEKSAISDLIASSELTLKA